MTEIPKLVMVAAPIVSLKAAGTAQIIIMTKVQFANQFAAMAKKWAMKSAMTAMMQ